VQTILVEKHGEFLRDFRGDTVHPSTTELMHEVGILHEFLRQVPHQTMEQLGIGFKGQTFDLIDFRHLPTACKYVVFMPQWDFLNFLADKAKQYPCFRLDMNTEATGLLREGDRVTGVTAQAGGDLIEIRADLTVACDGRWSVIREHSGLPVTATFSGFAFRVPTRPPKLSDTSATARSSSRSTVASTGSAG
jgi:2-polyprenyl-6-methoxyphenol hydroxylase-like FAD-dependent oxidoreductase